MIVKLSVSPAAVPFPKALINGIIQAAASRLPSSVWRMGFTKVADAARIRPFAENTPANLSYSMVPLRLVLKTRRSAWRNFRPPMTGLWLALFLVCAHAHLAFGQDHWVTTWGCGPQLIEPGNLPPVALAGSTLRQFVHVSLGGNQLRVRLSNAYGDSPVTLNLVHVALDAGAGSSGRGEVNPATDRALTFHGASAITIPPGGTVMSDPCAFDLPALANLAISIYIGNISATTINGHPGSRTTSFIQAGNAVTAASLPGAATAAHWYVITGVEVLADHASQAVVVLGDSITDGRGSTTDHNNRWPDDLAQRLQANALTTGVAVVNMGIGGNGIFGGLGPAARTRFNRDVLEQSGARWLIIFEGVNDIGGHGNATIATNLETAYAQFVNQAHARSLVAYGATITPFGGNTYFTASHEAARQTVNAWIRTNSLFDGVIDFDAVTRDPASPAHLLSKYNSGDGLHLSPAGYQAMANAIDLTRFTR